MKSYHFRKKLCLIGKGWQIRHHLRNMLALEKDNITLIQYLQSFGHTTVAFPEDNRNSSQAL